jgi:hypothetical protein
MLARTQAGTVNSIALPDYVLPGYVIGADTVDGNAATNRHRIAVECEVTITTVGSYKVEWELLDPADTIMAASNTVMGLISTVPVTQTVSGFLTPSAAQRLAVGVNYRVRARLVNTTTTTIEDTRTQPTGKTYIHFTGTDPASAELNAVSQVTSITVDRRHLLETNVNRRTIPVTVNYTLHRYDNWDAADDPRSVLVNLNTSLVRDDNNSTQTTSVSGSLFMVNNVSSYSVSGLTKIPTTVSGSQSLEIDPAAILAPEWYRVESEITHQEVLLPLSTFTGNRGVSDIELITHFTGELRFGPLVTHFASLNGAPTTVPTPLVVGTNPSHLRITPGNNSGTLDGITDYHYGDGTKTVNVTLDNNGVATVAGDVTVGMTTYTSETIELNTDAGGDNSGTVNGIFFKRYDPIKLDETGGVGAISAYLPTGVGWREDRYNGLLDNAVEFADVYFNQSLEPLSNPSINPGPDAFYLCEETKPVLVECTVLEWDLASGEFRAGAVQAARSLRKPLMEFLMSYAGSYEDSSMVIKYSNDHLYNEVTAAAAARVKKGASGGGEMTTVLSTASNLFSTHFPFASGIHWSAALSLISIENDLIKPNLSILNTASPVTVAYAQHCQEELERLCGVEIGEAIQLTSTTGNFKVTADGGLHASGSVVMDPLAWGAVPGTTPQDFAHQVMTSFTSGNFLMAGTFLRGDQNPLNDPDGPGVLLLSGFDPADLNIAERPESTEYIGGLADYAGMNFRTTGTDGGRSLIQGDPVWPYTLTARSKYYARYSGVTGIHEAQDGQFPGTATIGDYMFGFTKFGFGFLSNEQEESRTSGYLDLPDPTDFTLDFTNLRISCIGALESFDITGAGTVDSKEFDFWNALFTPYTARFDSKSDCDPGDGTTLVLGFSAHASHYADAFAGSLGIYPEGDFVTQNDVNNGNAAETVPTRLTLPGAMKMIGTTGESYDFFPAQGAYLNDGKDVSDGFWSLFGTLDVPFFKDMQVHMHTGCGSFTPGTPDPEIVSPIYIMGGWPGNGWTISGNDPFSVAVFDTSNGGFTNSLENYRKTTDNGDEQYLPRVQQEWLGGLINFDYPLKWSNAAFNFSGRGPRTKDLLVLTTQSELVYLDADNAELTFGARYEGLPTLSLSNFVFNAIDDTTGMSSAFITAAGDKVFSALEQGVDQMAKTVSDRADDLLGQVVDALTTDLLGDLIDDLKAEISTGGNNQADIELIISTYLGTSSQLTVALNKLGDNSLNADTLLAELARRLRKIEQSIDAVINQVTVDPETGVDLPVEEVANGLLKQVEVNGEFRRIVFEALSKELVDVLSTLVDASTIEEELAELIQEQSPSLDSVAAALEAVKAIVVDVREQVENTSFDDLGLEIHDLVISPTGGQIDIGTVTTQVELAAVDIVLSASTQDLANLDALADEWRTQIAREIKDRLYARTLTADIQEAVKERLADVQASFNEAVDTAFATLNRAIQAALSDVVAGLDDALGPIQGFTVNQPIKAGEISGYAHFNADSLDLLRLDAMVELALPDPMTIGAYFQIKELDSDGPDYCESSVAPGKTTEITLGATNIGLSWANLHLNGVRADMNVKFGLDGGLPVSMGGEFEMTEGQIGFETFSIHKLNSSVMFGLTENYIAAGVGVRFGEFDMSGGIFLGRSCTLEPLELIDPLVSQVVPTDSITGIYSYGEATFPIYGTGTCFFNISAKAGAGVLYFQEGPTYGGRMTLGVYGEALCAVEVGGEVSLAGTKSGDTYNFAGYGRVFGQAGKCPLCVKANFQVDFQYTDVGGWEVDF